MDPVDALTEIAFLLERDRAIRYKAKAFRTAGDIVVGLDRAVLHDPVRLRNTKGIGDTTYTVIRQALAGQVPDYLVKLRESSSVAATSELRGRLKGDLHAHTGWSDGTTSIELMVDSAKRLGHEYLAITDHSPRLTVARGLSAERLTEQLEAVRAIDAADDGIRVLTGIEVDITEDGKLDQTDEMLGQLDVVVASVHSKLKSDPKAMTRRMLAGIRNPHTDVLGHVTGRLAEGSRGTRPGSTFDARAVFAECAARGVAVEVNSRPERQDPPDELIQIALEEGCLFSIDSDAHAPGQLALLDYGAERAERNGIPPERIVTTYPVEQLLQWTGRNR